MSSGIKPRRITQKFIKAKVDKSIEDIGEFLFSIFSHWQLLMKKQEIYLLDVYPYQIL
jgi:hypothetical protein